MRAAIIDSTGGTPLVFHSHMLLGEGHDKNERKTWAMIGLCGAMMIAEIVGGRCSVRLRSSRMACI